MLAAELLATLGLLARHVLLLPLVAPRCCAAATFLLSLNLPLALLGISGDLLRIGDHCRCGTGQTLSDSLRLCCCVSHCGHLYVTYATSKPNSRLITAAISLNVGER